MTCIMLSSDNNKGPTYNIIPHSGRQDLDCWMNCQPYLGVKIIPGSIKNDEGQA